MEGVAISCQRSFFFTRRHARFLYAFASLPAHGAKAPDVPEQLLLGEHPRRLGGQRPEERELLVRRKRVSRVWVGPG